MHTHEHHHVCSTHPMHHLICLPAVTALHEDLTSCGSWHVHTAEMSACNTHTHVCVRACVDASSNSAIHSSVWDGMCTRICIGCWVCDDVRICVCVDAAHLVCVDSYSNDVDVCHSCCSTHTRSCWRQCTLHTATPQQRTTARKHHGNVCTSTHTRTTHNTHNMCSTEVARTTYVYA